MRRLNPGEDLGEPRRHWINPHSSWLGVGGFGHLFRNEGAGAAQPLLLLLIIGSQLGEEAGKRLQIQGANNGAVVRAPVGARGTTGQPGRGASSPQGEEATDRHAPVPGVQDTGTLLQHHGKWQL